MAASEEPWQRLLPGAHVRITGASRSVLEGATGVLGCTYRSTPTSTAPSRHLVRLTAPAEAVAAYPRGVFVPLHKLAAADGAPPPRGDAGADDGDGDSASAPNDDDDDAAAARSAARDADAALRVRVATALGMHGTQTLCNHGLGWSGASAQNHSALMCAAEAGAADGNPASMLRAARAWLAAHPGAATEALRRTIVAMGIDALSGQTPFPPFAVAQISATAAASALAVAGALAGPSAAGDDAAEVAAEALSSPLRVRRTLAAACICHCLRVCAARGCGAKRARSAGDGSSKPLLICGACRAAHYCCAEHQREHWPEHKRECKQLAASVAAQAAKAQPRAETNA
jgi:hypothetical protein